MHATWKNLNFGSQKLAITKCNYFDADGFLTQDNKGFEEKSVKTIDEFCKSKMNCSGKINQIISPSCFWTKYLDAKIKFFGYAGKF